MAPRRCQAPAPALDAPRAPPYTKSMRGVDLMIPRPEGLWCPSGGFYIDPVRQVERAVDHPRATPTTRSPGTGRCSPRARRSSIMALRLGAGLRGRDAGRRARATDPPRRRDRELSPGRARARLGAVAVEAGGRPDRGLRRLQAPPRRHLRAVRAGGLRRLRHRGDLRAAGVPPPRRPARRSRKLLALARAVPRAHAPRRRLRARQGAAADPAPARGRLRRDDLRPRGAAPALRY